MADDFVANPGAGGDTFAADDVAGVKYPRVKIALGADSSAAGDVSSTNPMPVTFTTPVPVSGTFYQTTQPVSNAVLTDVWNAITHTLGMQNDVLTNCYDAFNQRLVVDASQVPVDANLTSAGSTKVIGLVGLTSGTQTIGTVLNATSTAQIGAVALSSGTQVVGSVVQASGGSSATPWWAELVGGSSANVLGSVALIAGSSANILGAMALVAGTSANVLGSVALVAGTSANTLGSVALVAGSSATSIGSVVVSSLSNQTVNLALGTSATYNFMQSIPFSSGNAARTSVNTTVDISVIGANASRKGLVIANLSTVQTVALGLTTAAVTTALGGASLFLSPASQISFGLGGNGYPLFLGPIRGINITSTTVAGGVCVTEFS